EGTRSLPADHVPVLSAGRARWLSTVTRGTAGLSTGCGGRGGTPPGGDGVLGPTRHRGGTMIHHRPEFPARIMTITLQGAAVPFVRTLRFNPDLPCGDLMNRICVALGRYPAPGAVVHRDGAYTGHDG